MREGELFGENLVLRRSIETVYGFKTVAIIDEIENQGFRDEPLMLLYHINIGYPLLDAGTELLAPFAKEKNVLTFTVLEGAAELEEARAEIRGILDR